MNRLLHTVKRYAFPGALLIIVGLSLYLRAHNISIYNHLWADDGGAHAIYIEVLANEHRLPTMDETYVAWHEPLYYLLMVPVYLLGGIAAVKWAGLAIYLCFLGISYKLFRLLTDKQSVIIASLLVTAFLFPSVKLSSYPTNELLAQAWILLLAYYAIKWQLWQSTNKKQLMMWGILLGVGLWIKLTALLPALALIVVMLLVRLLNKNKRIIGSLLIVLVTAGIVHSPWLVLKQKHFGNAASINLYETEARLPIINRPAFNLFTTVNLQPFTTYPYWRSHPESFITILAADILGDYYHMFDHVVYEGLVNPDPGKLTGNGRTVNIETWYRQLWSNRVGLLLLGQFAAAFVILLVEQIRSVIKKKTDYTILFLLTLILGMFAALCYNVLRLPFLEKGTLKYQFILATAPLMAVLIYHVTHRISQSLVRYVIMFGPILLYIIVAWRILQIPLY